MEPNDKTPVNASDNDPKIVSEHTSFKFSGNINDLDQITKMQELYNITALNYNNQVDKMIAGGNNITTSTPNKPKGLDALDAMLGQIEAAKNTQDPRVKYAAANSPMLFERNPSQKEIDIRNKWLGNTKNIDGYNLENLVGDMQSSWQKLGYGTVRTIGGVVTKFVQGFGYLVDMAGGIITDLDYTEYLDSGIGEAVGGIEEAMKEALPIYKSTKYSQGSLLDKMGTVSFWADDFADGAAFALSALIPGGVIGKVGAGTKIVNALGKYSKMTQAMTKLNKLVGLGKYSPKALQVGFDRTLYTVYSSVSEAAFEAASVKKEIMNTYRGTINPDTGKVYSEQELKEMAATGAANTFKGNMALLMLSNRLEAGLMFGKSATGLVKPAKMLKELDRSAIKSNLKAFGKGIPKGVISEGGEEMVQYGISQHQIETAGKHEAWYSALGNTLQRTVKGFGEEEGMMNFITGAILGSTMGSISNVSENIGKRNTYRTISSNLDNNRDNLYAILGDIYERQDGKIVMEDQEIIDKDGNKKTIKAPKFNSNSAFQDGKRFSGMVALANEYRNAVDTEDNETANLIRDHAIRKWAIDYFMQGADAKFTIREMNNLLKQEATLVSEKKERIVREEEMKNIQELQKHFAKVISNAFDAYRTSVNPVIMARYDSAKTTEEKTAINAYMSSLYHSLNMKADLIDRQNEIQKLIVDLDARLQSEELNAVEKAVLSDKKAEIVDYSNKLDQQIKSYDNDVNESYNKMEREEWINDYIKKMNDEKDAVDNTLLYKDIDEKFESKEKDIEERIKTATTEGNVDELNAIKKDIEELKGSYFTTGFKGRQQRRAIENADRLILKINKNIEAARMVSLAKGLEGINAAKSKEELEEIFNDLAPEQQAVLSEALEVRKTAITRKEEWTPEKTQAAIARLFDPEKEHNYVKLTTVNDEEFIAELISVDEDALYILILEATDPSLVGEKKKVSIEESEFMEVTDYVEPIPITLEEEVTEETIEEEDIHENINEDPHSDITNDPTDNQAPKNDDISPAQLSVSQNNILNVNLKNDRLTEEQREFITSSRLMIDDEVVLVIDMTEIDTNKDKHDRIVKIMNGQKITSEDVEDLRNTIPIEIRSKGNMFATMANNNYLQLIIDTFNPIKDMIDQAKHEEEVKTKIVKFMSEINSYKDRVKTPAAAKLIVDAYIDLFGIDPREHAGNVPDVSLATTIMRVMLNNRVLGKYKSKFAANGKLIDEEIFSRLEQNINKWIDRNVSDLATSKAIRDIAVKQIVDSGKVNAEALKAIKIKGKVVRKTSSTPIETKGEYRSVKDLFDKGFINIGIVQNDGSIMPLTGKNRTPFKSPTGEKYNDGKAKLFFIINSKLTPTGISYPVAYYTNFINEEEAKIATTELKKAIKYKIHDIENESNQNENLIAQHMSKVKDIFNTSKIHLYERIITEKINDNEIRKGIGTIEIDNKLYNMYVANYTIDGKEYSRLEFKRDEDGKIFIKEQIDELFTTARHNVNYDMIFEKDKYGKVSYRADASDNIIKMINDGVLLTELNPVVRGDNYRFFDIQGRDGMNNIQIDIQIMPSVISEVSIQNEEGVPTNLSIDDIDLGGGDEFNFDNETDNDKKC